MQRGRKDRLVSLSSGLAMAVLLGIPLAIPFWLLRLFGVIRISGYWRAVDYVRRGRVLIVANHPSLIETFLIPLVFWPWAMFRLRMFVWSLPDKNLFKGFPPLVVEILSPTNEAVDRVTKRREYAQLGIDQYWIVDFPQRRIDVYVLRHLADATRDYELAETVSGA